jgi:hypothetical protein
LRRSGTGKQGIRGLAAVEVAAGVAAWATAGTVSYSKFAIVHLILFT